MSPDTGVTAIPVTIHESAVGITSLRGGKSEAGRALC